MSAGRAPGKALGRGPAGFSDAHDDSCVMPQVVIVDHSLTNVIASFGYNDDASFKKAISEAEKKMRAAKAPAK